MASRDKHKKDEMQKERRRFLKKTMYSAPTIIVLGGLLKPTKANANTGDFNGPPSDPSYTNDSWSTNT